MYYTLKMCVVVSLQDSGVSHLGHNKTKPVFVFYDTSLLSFRDYRVPTEIQKHKSMIFP